MTNKKDDLSGITLLRLAQLSELLGYSDETISDWVRDGKFPRPIFAQKGSPAKFRLRDVQNWLSKRARARDTSPTPRGFAKGPR